MRSHQFRYNRSVNDLIPASVFAFLVALVTTPLMVLLARRLRIVDTPGGRRIHQRVTPRLGGVAVLAAFFTVFVTYLPELAPHFKPNQLLGFSLAAALLLIVGVIDDKRGVPAYLQLLTHIACGLALVVVGMGIDEITNPLGGGKISLDVLTFTQTINGVDYHLNLPADLITVLWVVLVINALNWLDGLDGLAAGVGAIAAGTIALLSVSALVGQPHVALLALILAGSLIGFLTYNWQPARIFLGTVGSAFIGFTLATLAIVSGGKVATALLVLGFPILDALTLIVKRTVAGAKPWEADARHLHHLLLGRGWSVRQTVLSIYVLSACFGGLALLTQTTRGKAYAFAGLIILMSAVLVWLARPTKKPA